MMFPSPAPAPSLDARVRAEAIVREAVIPCFATLYPEQVEDAVDVIMTLSGTSAAQPLFVEVAA